MLVNEGEFATLVHDVYGAAGDPQAWQGFVQRYADAAGCESACLIHVPAVQASARVEVSAGLDEAAAAQFETHYSRINPYRSALVRLPAGAVVSLNALLPVSDVKQTEFYNDYVMRLGHHIAPTLAQLFSEPGLVSTLGLFSTSTKEGTIERAIAFQKHFVGHLQTALRLHHQIVGLESQVGDLLQALEHRGVAVASCDNRGRVLSLTRSAEAILSRNDGLSYQEGQLCVTTEPRVNLAKSLDAVAKLAEFRSVVSPKCLRVARRYREGHYHLVLCPVTTPRAELHASGARVLVFIFDPSASLPMSAQLLAESYGLTQAQARVVQLLATGLIPKEIAQRLCVSRETVKSHLAIAYAKTGTRGQGELIATALQSAANVHPIS